MAFAQPPTSPLFKEWLSLCGDGLKPESPPILGRGDALVIIDMQADFVPADQSVNPHGGRFGVAEGDRIVGTIVRLINAAVRQDAAVVATRDYHPVDHVSFMSEGGPFPAHCVQGTKGSYFLPAIGGALAAGMRQRGGDTDGVMVAFKAFHEDVDSFGAFPYASGGDGRIGKRSPGGDASDSGKLVCGCSAAPWTGCMVLKQSALSKWWLEYGEDIDMNAPPDVLALAGDESGDGGRRGQLSLQDALRKKKRLFVCGLALDFCVLDTCLNARELGFEEVWIVLDAARAAHIPGVGAHGTGFLSSPPEVIEKLRAAGVGFVAAASLGQPEAIGRAPSSQVSLVPAPSDPSEIFPQQLGPLGLMAVNLPNLKVHLPSGDAAGGGLKAVAAAVAPPTYSVELRGPLKSLEAMGFESTGRCSPVTKLPTGWAKAPAGATSLCWAYPFDGMAKLQQKSRLAWLAVTRKPELCFAAYGGFLLLDANGDVVSVQAIGTSEELKFSSAHPWRQEALPQLRDAGRLQAVTLPFLLSLGARQFCWVSPGETFHLGQEKWTPSAFGGFLYLMEGRDPVYFHLLDPVAVSEEISRAQTRIAAVQRGNTVRKFESLASTEKNIRQSTKELDGSMRDSKGGGTAAGAAKANKGSSACVLM